MNNRSIKESYILKNDLFNKYKNEVEKRYGKKAGGDILKNILKKDIEPSISSNIVKSAIEEPKRTFYDIFTGTYFESTLSNVLYGESLLNNYYMQGISCYIQRTPPTTVKFLHSLWGLSNKEKTFYDNYGWDSNYDSEFDQLQLIQFEHDLIVIDDDLEVIIISYKPYLLRE